MTLERPMFPPRHLAEPAGLARGAVTKRRPNPPARPLLDLDQLPDVYGLVLEGDCLEPLIPDGSGVIAQRSACYTAGDVVCIWWRPEFVKSGDRYQGWMKRIVLNAPPTVKKFPYNDNPKSDVKAVIVVEQLNPDVSYAVPCDQIQAIHKIVGYGPPSRGGKTLRADKILPIGDGIVPQLT
jgi:hypothetical protein